MLPDKFELARAGLYYKGKSDICVCFRCHVKLSSWERDEDAIKEHLNLMVYTKRRRLENYNTEPYVYWEGMDTIRDSMISG